MVKVYTIYYANGYNLPIAQFDTINDLLKYVNYNFNINLTSKNICLYTTNNIDILPKRILSNNFIIIKDIID